MPASVTFARIKDVVETVSFVAVIAGISLAYCEYRDHMTLWRKERSFELVSQFNESLVDARVQVLQPWLAYDVKKLNANFSQEDWTTLVFKVTAAASKGGDDIRIGIIRLTEFFDVAFDCSERGVCDADVLESQLGDYAAAFYCLYGPVIAEIRTRTSMESLGTQLTDFVAARGGCGRNAD